MSAQLDHVVLLLPYADILNPPTWLTKDFTISPGGRHADNKTENKLILFSDGTYLELIAFIDDAPSNRKNHWWDKPYGVVDYALTTVDGDFLTLDSIRERLAQTGTSISYQDPIEGGRIKPDGTELKWKVTFPTSTERGSVPFWCHDVTPRERRVPVSQESTTHPSGVVGMAGLQVSVKGGEEVEKLRKATAAIVDVGTPRGEGSFELGRPIGVQGKKPSVRIVQAEEQQKGEVKLSLVLQGPKHVDDVKREVEGGLVEILFEVAQ
ncbi:glyoxalase bleomycin resistance protein dioxygenase superfamily [Zymoseptoria brevis]|uniref:Glyoxalase bleomycin resistance protein dioxygenase superfamily n=1 Tax=Zymoseptoria brevis TaxID=1047168 RepID=A0A0F4GJY5_9PEZI|nr:glyoxalase bleomycin resistance protein dioxygenase superfamily [Zymoseptoria brevis]